MKKSGIICAVAGLVMTASGLATAADSVTLTGEVIDTYCYALKGAKGEGHRSCGIACIEKGIPAALLEEGSEKVYVLLPDKAKSPLPKDVIEKVGHKATVSGKVYTVGGSQFLTVESIK